VSSDWAVPIGIEPMLLPVGCARVTSTNWRASFAVLRYFRVCRNLEMPLFVSKPILVSFALTCVDVITAYTVRPEQFRDNRSEVIKRDR
jgi:hypothetical protein